MLQKSVRSVALFFAIVLSVGCSRDGTFERPDSIEVMTPEAVHGQVGHLMGYITVAKEGEEIVRQVVLVLRDSDVSTVPMFLIARYSSGAPHAVDENAVAVVKIIDALHAAVSVALVSSLPEGTKQEGGIKYGDDYDIFVCYLRVTIPSDTLYWSVWVTQKTRDDIVAQLAKPPKVIDTRPVSSVNNFVGKVLFPNERKREPRVEAQPIAGVIVTIVSGPHSGEQTLTNQDGQYMFRNIEENEIHLRVEKSGFELKEVIVHRSRPTRPFDGTISRLYKDPQIIPGNILIGHRWPDEVRFILQQTKLIDDLLFVRANVSNEWGGQYINGVAMLNTKNVGGTSNILGVIAHELAHAHQHAMVPLIPTEDVRLFKFGDIDDWEYTSEGRAYATARNKDHERFGEAKYETIGYSANLKENAAEFCAYFWSIGRWNRDIHSDLRKVAPNRYRWAAEWLSKK